MSEQGDAIKVAGGNGALADSGESRVVARGGFL